MKRLAALRFDDPEDYHQRGHWFSDRGLQEAASGDFEQAIRLRPNDPHLFYDRAACALRQGDEAAAISALRRMHELSPTDALPEQTIAWLYVTGKAETRRRPEEALPLARKALQLDPNNPMGRITLGAVHYRLGHYEEAARIFEAEAREQHPYRPQSELFLAMVLHRMGRSESAREAYQGALKWPRPAILSHPEFERKFQRLRAEAEAVLASPPDALPADVFARP